jgi:hypothetical protein
VAAVTVGDELEEERTVAFHGPFSGVFYGLLGGDDVHSIDLDISETPL